MRAKNMRALSNDFERRNPGVIVYGVGDDKHRLRVSDHNEDDTPGSKAAQSDTDTLPEHRAIDVMLGPAYSRTQALLDINEVLARPELLARLWYINFENWQWSRSHGWTRQDNSDDPHPTHVHWSGIASADDNSSPWFGDAMVLTLGMTGHPGVSRAQRKIAYVVRNDLRLTEHPLAVDSNYGPRTAYWVSVLLTGGLGETLDEYWLDVLDEMFNRSMIDAAVAAHLLAMPHGGQLPANMTFVIPEQTITVPAKAVTVPLGADDGS